MTDVERNYKWSMLYANFKAVASLLLGTMATLPIVGYAKQVKVVRLVFWVRPSTRFEDMCVSGIRLESELD